MHMVLGMAVGFVFFLLMFRFVVLFCGFCEFVSLQLCRLA